MGERRPILLSCYRWAARALGPLFHLLFFLRCRTGKEVPARKQERFGRSSLERPPGRLIWIHAASVGETVSVLPLIDALASKGYRILLTTVTVTSAEIARQRLPDGAIHQFSAYDAPGPVGRFLDKWRPDMAMVVESEIWPCLFDELRRRSVPFALVNGRLSERSKSLWEKLSGASGYIFGCLDCVLAQSEQDAERFRELGCRRVETPGNLKFEASDIVADCDALDKLRTQIDDRPVWLAALTHPGEDEIALDAFVVLQQHMPSLLLVLVPRHPARASEVASLVRGRNLRLVARSTGHRIEPDTQVFLGDTLGEMGLYYQLAPVTFLGGSFNEVGGHSPVEAALAGSALVTGPEVANARAVYKDFWNQGAAVRTALPEELANNVLDLFQDPEKASLQATTARRLVEAARGALSKTLQALEPMLASLQGKSKQAGSSQKATNGERS